MPFHLDLHRLGSALSSRDRKRSHRCQMVCSACSSPASLNTFGQFLRFTDFRFVVRTASGKQHTRNAWHAQLNGPNANTCRPTAHFFVVKFALVTCHCSRYVQVRLVHFGCVRVRCARLSTRYVRVCACDFVRPCVLFVCRAQFGARLCA